MKQLNEGLDYRDLENQMVPKFSIDKYEAKVGGNDEIVTLAFTVKSKLAGEDLTEWFEHGYDWVIDSQISDGEVSIGKYLVFVEMPRRKTVPNRIVELIEDLETLTGLKVSDWTMVINDEEFDIDPSIISSMIKLSPHEYRESTETELNEMRNLAGQEHRNIYNNKDALLKDFLSSAGL